MPCTGSRKRAFSRSSSCSTQSDFSVCSTLDSFEALCGSEDASVKHQSETVTGFNCATPTSSLGSPREGGDISCTPCCADSAPQQELDGAIDTSKYTTRDETHASTTKTKLKSEAPAFQPMVTETGLDVVANAVYLALVSSGLTREVKIEKGVQGVFPTSISVELQSGPRSSSRCYDVVHLARQTLEEITTRLTGVTLLSKRVQKEDRGYSLRSSLSSLENGAEDNVCWDAFHRGYCPRRSCCQWYHPQDTDIGRIKVHVRCSEDVSGESQLQASLPAGRHKISLGELV